MPLLFRLLKFFHLSRRHVRRRKVGMLSCGLGLALTLYGLPAVAGEVAVAVAANFTAAAREIASSFHAQTGHTVKLSIGSSGQLYAQITQGAPFDILLSADALRPRQAETDGLAVPDTRFTYAIGKLVLWSAAPGRIDARASVLQQGNFAHLAVANPATAPYGAAAIESLKALGVYDRIAAKIVQGESISQAFQFIASGNAELGFVALSQLTDQTGGSRWIVPENLYAPILQDAVLLKTGAQNKTAIEFFAFLKSPQAVAIITRHGYATITGK
jgi:molybdate transport system substrate-binding protein